MNNYLEMHFHKKSNMENSFEENSIENLVEHLEILSRTTPTTMPEWMN